MTDQPTRKGSISRRDLLKACALAAGGVAAAPIAAAAIKTAATAAPTFAAAAPAKGAGPVTIKFMSWWWAQTGMNAVLRNMVTKFHNAQNDVRIEEVGFPYSEYLQKILTQLAGGKLDADVLTAYDELAIRLIKSGVLEPMDPIVDKLGIRSKLHPAHQLVTKDNKLYAMVVRYVPYGLIYNEELYQKEGITKPPATIAEYLDVAKKVTKRPNQFGHAARNTMAEQNGFWEDLAHWVLAYDGTWAKAKKPLANTDAVIKAIKDYKRLYDEAVPQGATASDYRRMAWEGKVVQYIDNSSNILILKAGNPAIYPKINSAPPPWPNRQSIAVPNFGGIYAGSQKKDAARLWWEFFYRPENISEFVAGAMDIIPPYEGGLNESYIKGLHWVKGFQASKGVVFITMVEGFEANLAEFRQIILQRVSEVLVAGKTPEQAMKEAQTELEALAARI